MKQSSQVASRYAKSLIDLAIEQGVLEEVHENMQLFSKINKENPAFARMLKNPIISSDKKKGILNTLLKGKVHKLTLAFFDIITKKGREKYLNQIASEFIDQYNVKKGIQSANVISAISLSDNQKLEFIDIIKNITGRSKVELKEEIDESILGGFVLNIEDRQFDQSVMSKLNQLRNKFKDNPYIAKY